MALDYKDLIEKVAKPLARETAKAIKEVDSNVVLTGVQKYTLIGDLFKAIREELKKLINKKFL